MTRKIVLAITLALLTHFAFAETCPTVDVIKSKSITGWKAYDSAENKPLTPTREAQFKAMIKEFALAEWASENNKSGAIHCYYRDQTGSSLEAYLSKEHFLPKTKKSFWYTVSGYMHCAAGMDKCQFNRHLASETHLAKR